MAIECNYCLKFEFVDQSPSFALGFEAGRFYERLKRGHGFWDYIHTENVEMAQRLAGDLGYKVSFVKSVDDEWSHIGFERETPPAKSAGPAAHYVVPAEQAQRIVSGFAMNPECYATDKDGNVRKVMAGK